MATVHWFADSGEIDPQAVCTVDFDDEGMAVDFAHHLYRSVHGFGRSRLGFAIKDEDTILYVWRWDNAPIDLEPDEPVLPPSSAASSVAALPPAPSSPPVLPRAASPKRDRQPRGAPVRDILAARAVQVATRLVYLLLTLRRAQLRLRRGLRAAAATARRAVAGVRAKARNLPSLWGRLTRWERPIAPSDRTRRPPKLRRLRLELDHYLLAFIVALVILCGSPLYSVYSTVQRLQHDESLVRSDRSGVAAATRDAAKNVLSTQGRLDFRKLFWHLRIVGPTEIHLLAFDPDGGDGPRLIFETRDMLRWHLRSVRGADGTWWAAADTVRHAS